MRRHLTGWIVSIILSLAAVPACDRAGSGDPLGPDDRSTVSLSGVVVGNYRELAGVHLNFAGGDIDTTVVTTADAASYLMYPPTSFLLDGIPTGTYTITPSWPDDPDKYQFIPAQRTFTLSGGDNHLDPFYRLDALTAAAREEDGLCYLAGHIKLPGEGLTESYSLFITFPDGSETEFTVRSVSPGRGPGYYFIYGPDYPFALSAGT